MMQRFADGDSNAVYNGITVPIEALESAALTTCTDCNLKRTPNGYVQGPKVGLTFLESNSGFPPMTIREINIYMQVFADNVILMISSQSTQTLKTEVNRVLACVSD
ncbi:hypothetical protein EVAR_59719_1 [Eumeta japonica]|uniref:Uncharacterized protein n=1 Tax=Eumeta variegata TaxID=151549 RepID=A0A4C1XJ60_EUMVA|nr:hypothetical protein EVAR_59719_1 [Eumeta japonica]